MNAVKNRIGYLDVAKETAIFLVISGRSCSRYISDYESEVFPSLFGRKFDCRTV